MGQCRGDGDPTQAPDGLDHLLDKTSGQGVGVGPHQGPQLIGDEGGQVAAGIHDKVVCHIGGPEDTGEQQVVGHPRSIQHDVLIIKVNVVPLAHSRDGAGDVPGQHYGQVPGFGILGEHIILVRQNGHLHESAVFIGDGAVIEGDPVSPVALHQGGIQVVFILIREVPLLEGVPDDQPGDLIGRTESSRAAMSRSPE